MKIFLLCIVFCLVSGNCMAWTQISGVTITKIANYKDYIVVTYSPDTANNENCSHPTKGVNHFVIDLTLSSHSDNMHSSVLSALYTGKTIGFGLDGCYSWDAATIPIAYRIDIFADQ